MPSDHEHPHFETPPEEHKEEVDGSVSMWLHVTQTEKRPMTKRLWEDVVKPKMLAFMAEYRIRTRLGLKR